MTALEERCTRCALPAVRLVVLDDGTRVFACSDCLLGLYIALTCAAVNRGRRG